jgi:pimeloyl-ACP methyl ester carboxylesterase
MGVPVLLVGAFLLRAFGAAARNTKFAAAYYTGWLLCAVAGWLVASASGALSPVWLVFVLGFGAALIDFRRSHQKIWSGVDAVVVLSAGLFSVLWVDWIVLLWFALLATGFGFTIDLAIRRFSKRLTVRAVATMMVITFLGLVVGAAQFSYPTHPRLLLSMLYNGGFLHAGILPVTDGERIVLATGAVAWLERRSLRGPFPGALLFHGADAEGSRQSSAIVLKKALLDAGFVVLSVDHPGYGESPVPAPVSKVSAWDPLPTGLAALETLQSVPNIDKIYAMGHSMGSTDVLRLVNIEGGLTEAMVFGGALSGYPANMDDYWYKRFHTDRRMRDYISRDTFIKIREQYGLRKVLDGVTSDHVPIEFVRFERDWPDIIGGRDALYDAIPGRKNGWTLVGSHHYFNSHKLPHFVLVDTRVISSLIDRFRRVAQPRARSTPLKGN